MTKYMEELLNCQISCVEINPNVEKELVKYADKVFTVKDYTFILITFLKFPQQAERLNKYEKGQQDIFYFSFLFHCIIYIYMFFNH